VAASPPRPFLAPPVRPTSSAAARRAAGRPLRPALPKRLRSGAPPPRCPAAAPGPPPRQPRRAPPSPPPRMARRPERRRRSARVHDTSLRPPVGFYQLQNGAASTGVRPSGPDERPAILSNSTVLRGKPSDTGGRT